MSSLLEQAIVDADALRAANSKVLKFPLKSFLTQFVVSWVARAKKARKKWVCKRSSVMSLLLA